MAKKNSQILARLRRYDGKDIANYLSTEFRQNLKTIEYAIQSFAEFLSGNSFVDFYFRANGTNDITTFFEKSPFVKSAVRLSAGKIQITLNRSFSNVNFVEDFIYFSGTITAATLILESFDTTLKTIVVQYLDGSLSAADVGNGAEVRMKIYLDN
jgi:hypothetical protein